MITVITITASRQAGVPKTYFVDFETLVVINKNCVNSKASRAKDTVPKN